MKIQSDRRLREAVYNPTKSTVQSRPLYDIEIRERLEYIKSHVNSFLFEQLFVIMKNNYNTEWDAEQLKKELSIEFDFENFLDQANKIPWFDSVHLSSPLALEDISNNKYKINKLLYEELHKEHIDRCKNKFKKMPKESKESLVKISERKETELLNLSKDIIQEDIEDDI